MASRKSVYDDVDYEAFTRVAFSGSASARTLSNGRGRRTTTRSSSTPMAAWACSPAPSVALLAIWRYRRLQLSSQPG
jgi:hypothetical protein